MTQHPLADALRTARNRLQRLALEIPQDTSLRADAFDWANQATKALSQYEKSDTDRDQLREVARRAYEMIGNLEMEIGHPMETDFTQLHADLWKALASKTAIDPVTVGTSNCDGLEDHFPTGLRSKLGVTKDTLRWYSDGVIQCECECGASFAGTDEQEVRQLWAEHAIAAIRALASKTAQADRDQLCEALEPFVNYAIAFLSMRSKYQPDTDLAISADGAHITLGDLRRLRDIDASKTAIDPATVEALTETGFLAVMNANDRELALPLSAWGQRNLLKRRIRVAIHAAIRALGKDQ